MRGVGPAGSAEACRLPAVLVERSRLRTGWGDVPESVRVTESTTLRDAWGVCLELDCLDLFMVIGPVTPTPCGADHGTERDIRKTQTATYIANYHKSAPI